MERALPFRLASGVTSPDLAGIAQGDEVLAFQPVEGGVVGEVVAVAVRHDAAEGLAVLVMAGEGGVGALDPQVAVHRQEPQGGVAQQGAGQDAGLGQDLEAVADAQDVAAAVGVVVHRAHDRGLRGHGAAAQVVAEAEAAGDDDQVDAGQVGVLVPEHFRRLAPKEASSAMAMSRSRLMPGKMMMPGVMAVRGFILWVGH